MVQRSPQGPSTLGAGIKAQGKGGGAGGRMTSQCGGGGEGEMESWGENHFSGQEVQVEEVRAAREGKGRTTDWASNQGSRGEKVCLFLGSG